MLFSSGVYASEGNDKNTCLTAETQTKLQTKTPIAAPMSTPAANEQMIGNNLETDVVNASDENILTATQTATPTVTPSIPPTATPLSIIKTTV